MYALLKSTGYVYSYDMLGEGARTLADADRYYKAYSDAIEVIGKAGAGKGPRLSPGISVKLSAIHPRYDFLKYETAVPEICERLKNLCLQAKKHDIGLTVDAELKMLRVIKRLKEASPLTIKATFLGAHAFPLEFKENHQGYIDQIINEMLPVIENEGLADYIDAFCERNYFSKEELDQILEAGAKHGLTPKVHVNQFSVQGGVEVSIKHGARSVDHLEELDQNDIDALKESQCMPTILPSCSFFLNIPYGDARRLMNENIPVALATDYNPGSTPSGNIPFVMSLACIKMKMTPNEALNATTLNSAFAMNLEESHGSITEGKVANIIISKEIPSVAHIPYSFGSNPVESLILNGKIIFF